MTKEFRLWMMDSEVGGLLNETPFWRRKATATAGGDDDTPGPYAVHDEHNHRLQFYADQLAKELGIRDNMAMSGLLRKAVYHVVGVLHPQVGEGGMLSFKMMSLITDAVIRNAMRKGELNTDEDETLQIASSPVTLIRYLRSIWGSFNPKATLEGGAGKDAKSYDAWFHDQDRQYRVARLGPHADEFKSWHNKPEEAPAAPSTGAPTVSIHSGSPVPTPSLPTGTPSSGGPAPTAPTATHTPPSAPPASPPPAVRPPSFTNSGHRSLVLRVMDTMPTRAFTSMDMTDLTTTAANIAHRLGATMPSSQELMDFLRDKGVIAQAP